MVLVALGWWTLYQRNDAAKDARAECRAAVIQRTLDEVLRQRDAAQDALAAAEKQSAVDEQELAKMEREKNDLVAQAKGGICDIDDGDLGRLRDIR